MKSSKKNYTIYKTVEHIIVSKFFFRLSREKSVQSLNLVIQAPAIGTLGVIGCYVAIVGTAAVSIVSAKSRNVYCFSG